MDDHFRRMLEPSPADVFGLDGNKKAAFIGSRTFNGRKPGYVFKNGTKGVGYYLDVTPGGSKRPAVEENGKGPTGSGKKRRLEPAAEEPPPEPDAKGGKEAEEDDEDLIRRALEGDEIDEEMIRKVLELADKKVDVVELDLPGVKRLLVNLERKINTNQMKRVKYYDDPTKFMDSEVDLEEEIQNFKAVAAAPSLYPELVKLNVVNSLLGLVTHENFDISVSALSALAEITDSDVLLESEESLVFVDDLVARHGLELLVQNLDRLKEDEEDSSKGLYSTLQVLENLCDAKPSLASLLCEKTGILKFLLLKLKVKRFDDVKLYCSEILSILIQNDTENQKRLGGLSGLNAMDTLLQAISYYKRKDPTSPDEEECLENLFDTLCNCMLVPENQTRFRKSEGLDLMLRCLREKGYSALGAVRALDFCTLNSPANCEKLIELGGLKAVFPVFMGRGWSNALKKKKAGEKETLQEHAVSIVASLCSLLPEGAAFDAEDRLLAKFLETGFEKTDRTLELWIQYYDRVARAEAEEDNMGEEANAYEDEDEKAEARLMRRMDVGLYKLQRLTVIGVMIFLSSKECREHIKKKLHMEGRKLEDLSRVLKEYANTLGEASEKEANETVRQQRAKLLDWADLLLV